MIVHRLLAALLLGVAVSLPAAAQDEAPARPRQPAGQSPAKDAPAKRSPSTPPPTGEPADTSTPRGALKVLAAALRSGDVAGIKRVMHAANPAEVRMVSAMADMAAAMAQLHRSSVKSFGQEGARQIVGDAQDDARIDAADVKIDGETAVVTHKGGEDAPLTLKRFDGHWKLPVAELSRGAEPAALEEQLSELAIQTKLVRELAGEVEAGKYATPSQAHEAWQSRAMQVSTRRPAPQPKASDDDDREKRAKEKS